MNEMKKLITRLFYDYQDTKEYMEESKSHRENFDKMYSFVVDELQDFEK